MRWPAGSITSRGVNIGAPSASQPQYASDAWQRKVLKESQALRKLLSHFSATFHLPSCDGWVRPGKRLIVFFAGVAWSETGGGQRSVQLTKALLELGCQVLFFSNSASHEEPGLEGLQYFGFLPYPDAGLSPQQDDLFIESALAAAGQAATEKAAVFEFPCRGFEKLLSLAKSLGFTTAYDIIDLWSEFHHATWYDRATEKALLEGCDKVFYTSRALAAARGKHLPNAGDFGLFGQASGPPPGDVFIGQATLGYWGSLDPSYAPWFDWELLDYVASQRPGWEVNLIGPAREKFERPSQRRNIHYLGPRKIQELPAYLAAFDVCLVPFRRGALSAAVDPIKVYEYLAGGKPVAAANLPEVQGRPGVWCAEGKEQFVQAIEEALDSPPDSEALRAFARENSWGERARQLLQGLGFAG